MCLQMLTWVFLGSGESNLIFLKWVARRLWHFLMGTLQQTNQVRNINHTNHITTIKNLTNITKWTNNKTTSHTGIYSIPCKDSNKHYIGKTQRNQEKIIYEHKWSIKTNDDWNTLFSHMLELKHAFNFSQATLIKPIHFKKSQRLLESVVISKTNYIKEHLGFYQISPYLANIILNENRIKIENREEKKNSLCATILLRILSFSLSLYLLALPHPN